jgi:diadenosine tetraphosphate (Ap4A) HIT family hydrolase
MTEPSHCAFCDAEGAVLASPLAYARFDKYPVSRGHLLIMPRRHVADWFETSTAERQEVLALADEARALLLREHSPEGFNLGINIG